MKRMNVLSISLLLPVIVFYGCTNPPKTPGNNLQKQETPGATLYAIKNVNIIPMTLENEVIENTTLVVKGKMILSINEGIPDSAQIIDGTGKWLIPGLIDMHVHSLTQLQRNAKPPTYGANIFFDTQDIMTPYITNGVTTIFELNSESGHFAQRNEILKGSVIGPRMALSKLIDGGEGVGHINTPSDGRQAVRTAKANGYKFIKIYSHLKIETFMAIVDEANKQGLKAFGHIPYEFKGRTEDALVPNFSMVAHAEEYGKQSKDHSEEKALYYADITKKQGTWLTPTLIVMERMADQARSLDSVRNLEGFQYVHPLMQSKWITANKKFEGTSPKRVAYLDAMADFNMKIVKAFKEAGIPILAGTDAGSSGVIWGYSLHDELELLVKAGLTPEETLVSATRLPADWLGIDNEIGTIESGKYADLILLNENPLENIKNTRTISDVFVNGRHLDKTTIDSMLYDLAKRNTAALDKYIWKNRNAY